MDLLLKTYSNASDDEQEDDEEEPKCKRVTVLSSKGLEPEYQKFTPKSYVSHCPKQNVEVQKEAPVPGRYISKRERALSGSTSASCSAPKVPVPNPNPVPASQISGSLCDSVLPHDIMSSLRHGAKGRPPRGQMPGGLSVALSGHMKAVNAIEWSRSHAHLLASAGMDHTICIWNVWSRDQKLARRLALHNAAVKDVVWAREGLSILSCGYDCTSRLVDIEKGTEIQVFREDNVVGVVKFHPSNSNLFLSGGYKGSLRMWDIRSGKVVNEYIRHLGPILDIEFMPGGNQFISSSDVTGCNISENSITVWDISRQVPLSNQIYVEAYTCPCVRCHPFEPSFVAQSNGNYIAIFSSAPPFKLNKYKRYESHSVSGFPIKCNFSLDGERVISGSSDGSIYFYNYRSSELVKKIKAYEQACIDVAVHPTLPNAVAACSWNGDVSVF